MTEIGATSLKEAAISKNDNPNLLANVAGVNWEVINARELYYHRSCFRSYTRKERTGKENNNVLAFQSIIEHIEEKVFSERRTAGVPELFDMYQKLLGNDPFVSRETCDIRTFRSRLLRHFGPNLGEWNSQSSGYVFYDKEIPIEEILEVTRKFHNVTKNVKDAPIDDRIKDVASEIRKEVLGMNDSFSNWPPTEDELIQSETVIPLLLKTFLTALLSKRTQPSSRKQTKIDSIGQDIIYCIKNGKSRTLKHTLLSLCCKRKTGSRQVVKWLNRFGHGISYDEVCVLETSIALQQTKNQIQRNFVPNIIEPSKFVTFVWDNNDINPESLTGVAMHCTNGIIIQLAGRAPSLVTETPVSNYLARERERSFKAMPTTIDPIISKKRTMPATRNTELLPTSKRELHSRSLDNAWVVLRNQASSRGMQFAVPNWTGYNCLIAEKSASYHQVAYLPAIDKSPAKLETVAELLRQTKAKAEALGLSETDVVADQAIYAKAVEVLMMPQYEALKKFIVLRMGAFHTSCTFLAVIGKRFADAGLRDIILEANLLGRNFPFLFLSLLNFLIVPKCIMGLPIE